MSENTEVTEAVVEETFEVEHDGHTFVLSKDVLDDVEVLEAWEDGKHTLLLRAVLGQAQWENFKRGKPKAVSVYELLDKVFTALKVD